MLFFYLSMLMCTNGKKKLQEWLGLAVVFIRKWLIWRTLESMMDSTIVLLEIEPDWEELVLSWDIFCVRISFW